MRDRIEAGREVAIASRLHLHPDCTLVSLAERSAHLRHPGGEARIVFAGEGRLTRESGPYCPEFGLRRDGVTLVFESRAARAETGFCVAGDAEHVGYDLEAGAVVDGARFPW